MIETRVDEGRINSSELEFYSFSVLSVIKEAIGKELTENIWLIAYVICILVDIQKEVRNNVAYQVIHWLLVEFPLDANLLLLGDAR